MSTETKRESWTATVTWPCGCTPTAEEFDALVAGAAMSHIHKPTWGTDTLKEVDPEPPIGTTVIDNMGDAWDRWHDGTWHTPETVPMPWERIVKKYGPVRVTHWGAAS